MCLVWYQHLLYFVAIDAKNYNDVLLQTVYILTLDLPVLLMPSWAKNVKSKVRFLHEMVKVYVTGY